MPCNIDGCSATFVVLLEWVIVQIAARLAVRRRKLSHRRKSLLHSLTDLTHILTCIQACRSSASSSLCHLQSLYYAPRSVEAEGLRPALADAPRKQR